MNSYAIRIKCSDLSLFDNLNQKEWNAKFCLKVNYEQNLAFLFFKRLAYIGVLFFFHQLL